MVIIDSPTYGDTPIHVHGQRSVLLHDKKNNKGEADCAVWFHAACSSHRQVLVHAGDTDIFMYGLALCEQGHFQQKQVCVERMKDAEYVLIDEGIRLLSNMPELKELLDSKYLLFHYWQCIF